jgi:hypothetical protein
MDAPTSFAAPRLRMSVRFCRHASRAPRTRNGRANPNSIYLHKAPGSAKAIKAIDARWELHR